MSNGTFAVSGTKVLLLYASYLIGKTLRDTDLEDEFKVIFVGCLQCLIVERR